jgi:hypothetical protein
MKKMIIACSVFFFVLAFMTIVQHAAASDDKKFPKLLSSDETPVVTRWIDSLYNMMKLDSFGLQRNVFFYACKGYEYLVSKSMLQKTDMLTICDYSQSSSKKRLYVINLNEGMLLFNTFVSHGRNSGEEYAASFSNSNSSHKSSLGFLITGETYSGKNGYSMRFDGMEPGINSNVRQRDIVMHGSRYVNGQRADEGNTMGRSFGCPAVPYAEARKIIDRIKEGSCFFIYHPDGWYARTSQIINAHFDWPITLLSLQITSASN